MKTNPFNEELCRIDTVDLSSCLLAQCKITEDTKLLRCFDTATYLTHYYWVLKLLHILILAGPATGRMPTTYNLSPFHIDGENNYKLLLASGICRRLKKYSNSYSLLEW